LEQDVDLGMPVYLGRRCGVPDTGYAACGGACSFLCQFRQPEATPAGPRLHL